MESWFRVSDVDDSDSYQLCLRRFLEISVLKGCLTIDERHVHLHQSVSSRETSFSVSVFVMT
jgi:predicted DNA-binding protein with PD1-like motif